MVIAYGIPVAAVRAVLDESQFSDSTRAPSSKLSYAEKLQKVLSELRVNDIPDGTAHKSAL